MRGSFASFKLLEMADEGRPYGPKAGYDCLLATCRSVLPERSTHPLVSLRPDRGGRYSLRLCHCANRDRQSDHGWIDANEAVRAVTATLSIVAEFAHRDAYNRGGLTMVEANPLGPILWNENGWGDAVLVAFEKPTAHEVLEELEGFAARRKAFGNGFVTVADENYFALTERHGGKR